MRNSPVASTPPRDLPYIPGVSKGVTKGDIETNNNKQTIGSPHKNHSPILSKAKESDLDKKIPGKLVLTFGSTSSTHFKQKVW